MKYYVISEEVLRQFLYEHAQDTPWDDECVDVLRTTPAIYYSDAHDFDGKLLGSLWATNKSETEK